MNFLQNNFKYLRSLSGKSQAQLSLDLGFSKGVWFNYEAGTSRPSLDDFLIITKYFGYTASDLLESDLQNAHLIKKNTTQKKQENAPLISHPNAPLIAPIQPILSEIKITIGAETEGNMMPVPITDISVAAGSGAYNSDYISNVDVIRMPVQFLKKNATYLCVKIKGVSMAPTLLDGGYVIIRLLDKGEWAKMHDERVFVVSDMEGKGYLKRVKNRFKQGFIVLKSDSPDQSNFPSFNLAPNEINSIWEVEWYLSAKMPNIQDQYYTRLQRLEDRFDELLNNGLKINPKRK